MRQNGRKSKESIMLGARRPRAAPPENLNEAEALVWRKVINRLPPDWFSAENLPLLEMYCCHVTRHRLLDAEMRKINLAKSDGIFRMDQLAKIARSEATVCCALATRLRLTSLSRGENKRAKPGMEALPNGDDPTQDAPWLE